jgi:hypothetical protein
MKIPKTDVNNFYNGRTVRQHSADAAVDAYLTISATKLTTKCAANANINLA